MPAFQHQIFKKFLLKLKMFSYHKSCQPQKYQLFFTFWVEPPSWRLLLEQCDGLWVIARKPKINPNWNAIDYDSLEKQGVEGDQGYSIKGTSSFFLYWAAAQLCKPTRKNSPSPKFRCHSPPKSVYVKTDYHLIDINRAEFRELRAGRIILGETNGAKYCM